MSVCFSDSAVRDYFVSVREHVFLDSLNCGCHCCNLTSSPPATCARALRENTSFCVGVRRPNGRGLRYIRVGCDRCHTLPVFPCSKEHEYGRAVSGTGVPHCHSFEVGGKVEFLMKISAKDSIYLDRTYDLKCCFFLVYIMFTYSPIAVLHGSGKQDFKGECVCFSF